MSTNTICQGCVTLHDKLEQSSNLNKELGIRLTQRDTEIVELMSRLAELQVQVNGEEDDEITTVVGAMLPDRKQWGE